MKFHEYLTYVIIALLAIELIYKLFTSDWGSVGIAMCAIVGWFYVQGYERQERFARQDQPQDQIAS